LTCGEGKARGDREINSRRTSGGYSGGWMSLREGKVMRKFLLPVVIEKDKDGYFAFCPVLQGCYTQGDSYEEVLNNIEDAVRLHIENCVDSGERILTAEG
jgi:predicted RNase H-like HicB family nuclease